MQPVRSIASIARELDVTIRDAIMIVSREGGRLYTYQTADYGAGEVLAADAIEIAREDASLITARRAAR